MRRSKLNHSTSRTLAALLGSMPVAVALGIALAAALPLRVDQRYLVGSYSVFPVWVTLACSAFLAESGRRAWWTLACAGAAATLLAWIGLSVR